MTAEQKISLISYGDGPRAIYELLKRRIIAGELAAGSELKIMPLAEELGVSIVPVREAVRMLAAEDLIESRPRRSPVIAKLDQRDLFEINNIRIALEPIVLADAMDHHTEETYAACADIIAQDKACSDIWEKAELNKRFHMTLLGTSQLKRTIAIIEGQYVGMARIVHYRLVNFLAMNPELAFRHQEEHDALFEAIRAGDKERATSLVVEHIELATARARKLFEEPN